MPDTLDGERHRKNKLIIIIIFFLRLSLSCVWHSGLLHACLGSTEKCQKLTPVMQVSISGNKLTIHSREVSLLQMCP